MSMSPVKPERLRLLPPYQLAGLALLLVLLLALVFPRTSLQGRLLGQPQSDQLAIAYLEAWQRVEPDNPDVLGTLTREYLKGQRAGDAHRLIARLKASRDPATRQDALLIEIGLAQTAVFSARDAELRALRSDELALLLQQALPLPWQNSQLEALAETARQGGVQHLTPRFYAQLAQREPARAAHWWRKTGEVLLAQRQYLAAARACFAAQQHETDSARQRQDFLAGLRALQMGNLLPEAMQAAEQHAGKLLDDAETLRFLTRLALASGRPDLAEDYVRRLLKAAPPALPDPQPQPRAGFVSRLPGEPVPQRAQAARVEPARAEAPSVRRLDQSGVHSAQDLDLAYQVFMANGNVGDAQKIARLAMDSHLDPALWQPRLAQAALWNRDPATALAQFLQLAQQHGDEAMWRQVETLAKGLNDTEAQLQLYRHQLGQRPGDLSLVDKIVRAEEMAGRPEQALSFLQARSNGPQRIEILRRVADLAWRSGHDALALQTWQLLMQIDAPRPAYALPLAKGQFRQQQYAASLATLDAARPLATGADVEYWQAYSVMASQLQDREAALRADRQLLNDADSRIGSGEHLLEAMAASPRESAPLALRLYRQTGHIPFLARSISAYVSLGDLAAVDTLLNSLSPEALHQAERSADFLLARSDYALQSGQPVAGLADLSHAARLAPRSSDVQAAWIWGLIAQGQDTMLRQLLPRFAARAESDASLIGAYAAAWLSLGEPHKALHYFALARRGRERDPLWLLAYAEAMDLAQRPGAAWQLRQHVWRDLLPARLTRSRTAAARQTLLPALVALSGQFTDADHGLALLRQAMQQAGEPLPPAVNDAALAWAQSHEAHALVKSWLTRRYLNWLAQPAQAQVALALQARDTVALNRLLTEKRGQLPQENRIEAMVQTGRLAEAQSSAFAAMQHQPDNDSLQTTLREQLQANAQSVTPFWRSVRQNALRYDQFGLSAGLRLDERQSLQLGFLQRNQRSDAAVLPGAPGQDHTVSLGYRWQGIDTDQTVTVASRQGWRGITQVRLEGSIRGGALNYALGSAQNAEETSVLLLGGMKNLAALGGSWQQGRWFASGRVEYDRFYLQDRSFLGEGYQASLDAGYKFRFGYPDFTAHLVANHGQYSPYGSVTPSGLTLLPNPGTSAAAEIMPQTFTQSGLLLSFGTDLPGGYSHAFRPYLEAGPVYDSHAGWGASINLGVVGSVFGRDRLSLFYQHQDMAAQGSSPVTEVGVRYSWFY
ncbi:tetratricopeptide repeat protein [Paludibacterium sp. B53371]|uniref:tetratricopeptide repeat protein n=1 Tax=Paludibacterium sp. B53371 TaxID=2806263 RepID=UPI001C0495DE|nr:tetratricopeptide repeat protein [Paludibacterium sp. B53371]